MYYSNEGVSFEPTVKACNRQNLFKDLVNRDDLLTETSRFAHVLSLRQITVYVPVEEMERITNAAVTAFMEYAREFSFSVLCFSNTKFSLLININKFCLRSL